MEGRLRQVIAIFFLLFLFFSVETSQASKKGSTGKGETKGPSRKAILSKKNKKNSSQTRVKDKKKGSFASSGHTSGAQTYKVKRGDTLYSIAKNFGVSVDDLMAVNGLTDTKLSVGQTLLIPSTKERAEVTVSEKGTVAPPPSPESYLIHEVKEGETLYRISLMYGVSIEQIKLLNHIKEDVIVVGEKLRIPVQGVERPALIEPKRAFTVEEESLAKKLGKFTLNKEMIEGLREKFLEISKEYEDARYKFGGESKYALDCSAFVQRVYAELGIQLPRNSYQQYQVGESVNPSELIPGDLVFFKTSRRAPVTHVGIYIGDNKFIHISSYRKGLAVDSLDHPYYKERFVGAKRILNGEVLRYFQEFRKREELGEETLH